MNIEKRKGCTRINICIFEPATSAEYHVYLLLLVALAHALLLLLLLLTLGLVDGGRVHERNEVPEEEKMCQLW